MSAPLEPASVDAVLDPDGVATVTFTRGRHNYFNVDLLTRLAETFEQLERDGCRAILLRTGAKHFCAGADFGSNDPAPPGAAHSPIYALAPRLFAQRLPLVAALRGAAIGGGLGVAMVADFRVGTPQTRLAANFVRLGISQGFALTLTLPKAIGPQRAKDMLLTGRTVTGEEAYRIGLCDRLASEEELDQSARALAAELANTAPLAQRAIRANIQGDLAGEVAATLEREWVDQTSLKLTDDFSEGVAASKERRTPRFSGS